MLNNDAKAAIEEFHAGYAYVHNKLMGDLLGGPNPNDPYGIRALERLHGADWSVVLAINVITDDLGGGRD